MAKMTESVADELVNSIMFSSCMENRFKDIDLRNSGDIKKMSENYPDDFDYWFNKSEFNYKYVRYVILNCPQKFFKWWNPYKIKMDQENVLLLAQHCGEFSNVWWSDGIDLKRISNTWNGKNIWYHLIDNCKCSIGKWWDPECFPWYDDILVNKLTRDAKDCESTWSADYIMQKLSSEELEVSF